MNRNNKVNLKETIEKITDFYPLILNITKKEARGLVLMQILKYRMIFLPLPRRYMIISKEVRDNIMTIYDARRDEIAVFFKKRLLTSYSWEDRAELYIELAS